MVTSITSTISGILISAIGVPPGVPKSVLTQNPHPTSSTQQAEQASFTRKQIPKRASQFSLKINKRQSSYMPKLGTCRVVPDSSIFAAEKPCKMTYSYEKLSSNKSETIQEL
jgi:hypothetical protein